MARERLGEILIKAGLLDEFGLQRALNEQQRWGGQLGRYLVELGLITEETLVRALSTQYKLPAVALDPPRMNISVGRLIPKDICERHGLVCFRADLKSKFLDMAMSDPSNVDALDEVRVATKFNVRQHIAAPTVIDKAISYIFYGDMALGGEIDLTPGSMLRNEPQTSELAVRARAATPVPAGMLQPQPSQPAVRPRVVTPAPSGPPPQPPAAPAVAPISPRVVPSAAAWSPGVTVLGASAPSLEVKVSGSPVRVPETPTLQSIRVPTAEEAGFHITLDVPVLDEETLAASGPNVDERLKMLEATLARNNTILQGLLEALVKRGLFSQDEMLRIVTGLKQGKT